MCKDEVSLRVMLSKQEKELFSQIADEYMLSPSNAVNILVKQVIREGKINDNAFIGIKPIVSEVELDG